MPHAHRMRIYPHAAVVTLLGVHLHAMLAVGRSLKDMHMFLPCTTVVVWLCSPTSLQTPGSTD